MKAGFSVADITPRIGVELFGYGPFLNRKSESIREPLEARSAALESNGRQLIIIGLDLGGITPWCVKEAKHGIRKKYPHLTDDDILIVCSHTHTGPGVSSLGRAWGAPDPVWEDLLPWRIVRAAEDALKNLEPVTMALAVVPCEGIGINRVYDKFNVKQEEGRNPEWRPEHPEWTDTVTTVVKFTRRDGTMAGFLTNFGAHPVVSGPSTAISGDYPEIAIHNIMRTIPGSVGIFLQGALGDVNTCLVGDPGGMDAAMHNLNIIAGRFESAIRHGLETACEISDESLSAVSEEIPFDTHRLSGEFMEEIRNRELEKFTQPEASESSCGMSAAILDGIGIMENFLSEHPDGKRRYRLHLLRIGPFTLFGAPLEMFQAIKRDIIKGAASRFPLIVSLADGEYGYAPDTEQLCKEETYESKISPLLTGLPPFSNIHHQLVENFLLLEKRVERGKTNESDP